jgi:CheY-like chemotaxis protein
VRLPLASSAEPAAAAVVTPTPIPGPARRILVADDNRDSVESLALLLRLYGHEVEVAHDGEEAVAKAERFRPHVALLDIGMPRLSGHEAARKLRQRPWGKRLLLVAATGWAQAEERERARASGFDAHLVKPVNPADLMNMLATPGPLRPKARAQAETASRGAEVADARDEPSEIDAEPAVPPGASEARTAPLILVVDDFPGAREANGRLLALSGYRVEEAGSGPEALRKGFESRPAMILMDLAMPGMDGWETIRRLKADSRTRSSRIVILTGAGHGGGAKRAKEAGCDAYLIKPCLPEALLEVVRSLLEKNQ